MDKSKYGVHQTHCCIIHGCKYGDEDCPVESGEIEQDYDCEDCDDHYGDFFLADSQFFGKTKEGKRVIGRLKHFAENSSCVSLIDKGGNVVYALKHTVKQL